MRQLERLSNVGAAGAPTSVLPCPSCGNDGYASDRLGAEGAAEPGSELDNDALAALARQADRAAAARPQADSPARGAAAPGPVAAPALDLTQASMAQRVWHMGLRAPGLAPAALRQTVAFLQTNYLRIRNQRYVTIIDYSQPSSNRRMYVFDLATGGVGRYPVAHGEGSGDSLRATRFSNRHGSLRTPLGAFLTAARTDSSQAVGFRLVLHGAERENSNAAARGIVMHGAWYATDRFLRNYGYVGRSHGCPAMDPNLARTLLPALAGGSLVYHYGQTSGEPPSA